MVPYVTHGPQVICTACTLSRLRCASLSWQRGCSGCETVGGISLDWSGLLPPRGAWWHLLPCVDVCVVDAAWAHNAVTFEDYLINTFMNIIKYGST